MTTRYRNTASGLDIGPGQPFTLNGIKYPANWTQLASAEEIAAIGLEAYEPPAPEPAPPEDPAPITDRQFAHELWKGEELISASEARAFVKTGIIPAALDAVIEALPISPDGKEEVRFMVEGAQTFEFSHVYTQTLMTGFGWSAQKGRAFFEAAALR